MILTVGQRLYYHKTCRLKNLEYSIHVFVENVALPQEMLFDRRKHDPTAEHHAPNCFLVSALPPHNLTNITPLIGHHCFRFQTEEENKGKGMQQ
jgi:hypothetical protein